MFTIPDYSERALTPPLGGIFDDLRLWVRPMLKLDRDGVRAAAVDAGGGKVDFNFARMFEATDALTERLIVGWENTPTPFSPENLAKLRFLADELTGQPKPLPDNAPPDAEPDKYRLYEYVFSFASNLRNYEKN